MKNICIKIKSISQRKVIPLLRSSNMAAAKTCTLISQFHLVYSKVKMPFIWYNFQPFHVFLLLSKDIEDRCMWEFTPGQINKMEGDVKLYRPTLVKNIYSK